MHFGQYASSWWDKSGPLKTLHAINNPRLEYIKQHSTIAGKNILDVGCGGGILTESLYGNNNVWGLDVDSDLITVAKEHAKAASLPITYLATDASSLAYEKPHYFDIITAFEVIEHIEEQAQFFQALGQLLAPSGILFISTINRTWQAFIEAKVAAEYILKLLPQGSHNYQQFVTPYELSTLLANENLQLQHLQGIGYNPCTNQAYLKKSLAVNYIGYAYANKRSTV